MNRRAARLLELVIVMVAIVGPQMPQVLMANNLSSDECYKGLAGGAVSASVLMAYRLWRKNDKAGLVDRIQNSDNGNGRGH